MTKNEVFEEQYIQLPEAYSRHKLDAMYREIPLKDTTCRTLRKYFNAMANLYGTISLQKAFEIISNQSPSLVTADEFLAFAEIARHEDEQYYILSSEEILYEAIAEDDNVWEREIVSNIFFEVDGIDLYIQTKLRQQGKPYYIPKEAELLKYEDPFYCECIPEVDAMWNFIDNTFDLDSIEGEILLWIFVFEVRYHTNGMSRIMEYIDDNGLVFPSEEDCLEFIKLYQDLNNHMQMPGNRGYAPIELTKVNAGNTTSSVKKQHAKVGRNDPCPCGSGKKYKKCCGR